MSKRKSGPPCPKCGEQMHNAHMTLHGFKELWGCWSWRYDGGLVSQSKKCRERSGIKQVAELQAIIDHVSPIAYAAEEWAGGRITDDDLRAVVAKMQQATKDTA